jgi:arsenical pump membrane protein
VDLQAFGARVGPILGFLVCITVIAELADMIGIFRALAYGAARLARGSVLVLWLLVVVVAAASSALLSLDTTAVLITPVVLVLARRLHLDLGLFAYTAVWLANTASLLFPVSNLTNLLAMSWLSSDQLRAAGGAEAASFGGFAALMWPAALAAFLITVGMLAVIFRRSLRGSYPMPGWRPVGDRVLFVIAAVVCAGLGPAFALGVSVFIAAAIGAAVLAAACLVRNPRMLRWKLVPWQLVLGVSALFLIVQFGHDHGLGRVLGDVAGTGDSGGALLWLSTVSAAAANLVNNLPAYLALEPVANTPLRVSALLVGVNAGPLILPWGSLATLLWASRCKSAGVRIPWGRFARRGLVLVPLLLVGCVGATVAVRVLTH